MKNKPKIQAIYALNTIQQGLLFHHLMEGDDQGFLTVQCNLEGILDIDRLKQAWSFVTARHEVMRTSVHWRNIERPMMVVRPEKDIQWSFLDWRMTPEDQQIVQFESYKKERISKGVVLDDHPLSKISLIQTGNESYYLLWECHHLLLDGWSSTIILRDAFAYYEGLCEGKNVFLPEVPALKTYETWLKSTPSEDAAQFWSKTLSGFKKATLFGEWNAQGTTKAPIKHTYTLDNQMSKDIKTLARSYKVTLNTFFQGIWTLALARCFDTNDVTFGNTVSGRSIPFPDIDRMAGMFTNVLPVRSVIDATTSFHDLLKVIQTQQQEARNYEYCKIDEITAYAGITEDKTLFDSLFVFENFPWEDIYSGGVAIKNFQSGLTTTYPVTAIFKIESHISYELLVDTDSISQDGVSWLLTIVPSICKALLEKKDQRIEDILERLEVVPNTLSRKRDQKKLTPKEKQELGDAYVAPRNQTELALVEIWEQLFGVNYLSIKDSFFALGGKSLLSVKMFTRIQEKLGVKMPPTTLLESPTIEALAAVINAKDDKNTVDWKFLVPIKTKGNKAPLFCIHAGGGHVFFYKGLADAIDEQRPVYALQPIGVFGEDTMHQSIQEMARDYADEICIVQPEGTINVVVYCFSTAVGLEMASYLKTKGRKAHLIVADTIAEHRLLLDKERLSIRVSAFLKRFFSNPFTALYEMIGFRIMFYIKPLKVKLFGTEAEKNTETMRLHLVSLFNAYKWNIKTDSVSLVLTEKGDERYNKEIERSWKPLVENNIDVRICKARHVTFFEHPDVLETAKAMDEAIVEY